MKRLLPFLFLIFSVFEGAAQVGCDVPGNYCMADGTFNLCEGNTIFDAGGGNSYPDSPFTMTICPQTPGDVIQLHFSAFALQTSANPNQSDYLSVYDGPNTSAASLGSYTGSSIQGLDITGTVNNPTGCLTLVFDPNGAANVSSPGFEAQVSCTTPCAPPTSASAITNPVPDGPEQSVSVCINAPVSFSGQGSFVEPGFTLSQYIWNFDDGTIDTLSGMNVSHLFTEPGEYIVTLTVQDNNGCQSLNTLPLQVLVSTIPLFPTLEDITTCFGEQVTMEGSAESVTWTALPPQVVAGTTYLADGAGFSYSTSLNFDFFEPGATLTDCADLYSIVVNMEHSYMGDLGIFITCPDGTSVDLITWGTNEGGGTFLGEALDDDGTAPGVGWDYFWAPDATNGTWGDNAGGFGGGSLPSGTYEASGNLCDLVGCPLNGAWTFSVTDNLAIDNGYIFYWGINFNPALFPGITTFTPSIGGNADSSYWVGPNIVQIDSNQDIVTINPTAPGSYDYTYYVVNDFGCSFDTTITITFEDALDVSAGPDQLYSCSAVELQGSFVGMPAPTCSQDAGSFNYCYNDGEVITWTWCPDNPGDGTAMTLEFLAGSTESFYDQITIYDGPNTSSPILQSGVQGNLAGLSWTATNPQGCLTLFFTADGSVSCASGSQTQWQYTVGCGNDGPQYVWEWTPVDYLNNPNIPQPTVSNLPQNTVFTLTGYPVGHPACSSTDQVSVNIDPLGDPGQDALMSICGTDAPFDMLSYLNGTPVSTGVWTDPNGNPIPSGIFDPMTNPPGVYVYSVSFGNCTASAALSIVLAGPTLITISNDTAVCYGGDLNLDMLSLAQGQAPFTYSWTYDNTVVGNSTNASYNPIATGTACLTVVDACNYTVQACLNVIVEPQVDVVFEADTTNQCWPLGFTLTNLTNPSTYINSTWLISDGSTYDNQVSLLHNFDNPGNYDVSLVLVSPLGCSYSASYPNYLTSWNLPVAGYTSNPQPTNANNTTIDFTDQSQGNITDYYWILNPNDVNSISTLPNPSYFYPIGVSGEYPVYLQVTDIHNCTDFIEGTIVITDIFQYYIPNSFSPNDDQINDVFKFYGADIDPTRFELRIFNRWGDKVFETKDPLIAWTGNDRSGGYFCPDGVYLWQALVTSKSTGEKHEIDGQVTIFR